jgi:hypothetical protein
MSDARRRLPELVLAELRGADWRLERGSRHWHLCIGGELVAVIPHGTVPSSSHSWVKTRADIRRFRKKSRKESKPWHSRS